VTDYAAERNLIEGAIDRYLGLFNSACATLRELALALDGLTAVYFTLPEVEPSEDAPDSVSLIDESEFGTAAARLFPDLGYYNIADPEGPPDESPGGSIASGDLTEIATDLSRISWMFENALAVDAIWEFRWGYQYHWGKHLHEVRCYLHVRGAW
jgi:Domain of unknown function (DUF5063)